MLTEPAAALTPASATVTLVLFSCGRIQTMQQDVNAAGQSDVDLTVGRRWFRHVDGQLPPGSGPDSLHRDDAAVAFVMVFHDAAKPIAAICHGPSWVIKADAARGCKIVSWLSLRPGQRNAGVRFDDTASRNSTLVTSRNPEIRTAIVDRVAVTE